MRLDLSADQDLFRATTAAFLDAVMPVGEVRARRDDTNGFDRDYWVRGAELGWTSLLVAEERGGGTIGGEGLVDLTLVAHELGAHAAPGPVIGTNVVASALNDTAASVHGELLTDLLSGAAIASWCNGAPPFAVPGTVPIVMRVDGSDVVLDGVTRPVESAAASDVLLVTGRTGGDVTQVVVPTDAAGVTVTPLRTPDLTRRFGRVRFDGVRLPRDAVVGVMGGAREQAEHQLQIAVVLTCAEAVGAMQRAFDMTVEWAFVRYSFGRPLASYQALKHRFADMKSWLEASHAITDAAATAIAHRAPDALELASAAKAFVGEYGAELMQDCMQIHGGIGQTFDHDLHLFLRRVTLNGALHGTTADHRQRLARVVEGVDAA